MAVPGKCSPDAHFQTHFLQESEVPCFPHTTCEMNSIHSFMCWESGQYHGEEVTQYHGIVHCKLHAGENPSLIIKHFGTLNRQHLFPVRALFVDMHTSRQTSCPVVPNEDSQLQADMCAHAPAGGGVVHATPGAGLPGRARGNARGRSAAAARGRPGQRFSAERACGLGRLQSRHRLPSQPRRLPVRPTSAL